MRISLNLRLKTLRVSFLLVLQPREFLLLKHLYRIHTLYYCEWKLQKGLAPGRPLQSLKVS